MVNNLVNCHSFSSSWRVVVTIAGRLLKKAVLSQHNTAKAQHVFSPQFLWEMSMGKVPKDETNGVTETCTECNDVVNNVDTAATDATIGHPRAETNNRHRIKTWYTCAHTEQ
jgi:hypothetical protein